MTVATRKIYMCDNIKNEVTSIGKTNKEFFRL